VQPPDGVSAGASVLRAAGQLSRSTPWVRVRTLPLTFPTYHPQGLALVGEHTFLSSVQVLEEPVRRPPATERTSGRGVGHLFVIGPGGALVRDIAVGEGEMYHPGGIDFDGSHVWVPVAEYRAYSASVVLAVDPVTFTVTEKFRVQDHISWVVSDPRQATIHGGNWGSRRFYTWSTEGTELDRWDNGSDFVDYQDCQYLGSGQAICGGVSALPRDADGGESELGGLAIVDLLNHRIVHETPVQLFSSAHHVVTRNPVALTMDADNLCLHVAPDDGTEGEGTELLTYTATAAPTLLMEPRR